MNSKMKIYHLLYIILAMLLIACSSEDEQQTEQQTLPKTGKLTITSSVNSFEGENLTRTDIAGTAFAEGDWIKLKIICPYVSNTLIGETTWGNSSDALWLLKWSGSAWTTLTTADKVDISSHYSYGYNSVFGQYEAQQTPYIYTASTWNENVIFRAPNTANGSSLSRYSQYSYIFQANQSEEADYLKSDLLWAQSYMQTGSYNVHLSFNHVMACLKITIETSGFSFTNTPPIVTLEGMPDIDQQEVVVGDYYAAASKVNSKYGYQDKCTCEKANNGKVLGIAVVTESQAKAIIHPLTGSPSDTNHTTGSVVANTGVYTAYYNNGSYYLIVPPCTLNENENAVFMIRDGEKRYSYTLTRTSFEQGKQYPVNITLTETTDPVNP